MRNKNVLASLMLTVVASAPLSAQSPREIHPRSCARADSVLPAHSDVLKGRVRVTYSPAADSTTLGTGAPLTARASARMAGRGPAPAPVAQLTVFLHSGEAEIVERGEQPPIVTLVTDDSVSRELSPSQLGTFVSVGPTVPPRQIVRVPLSAELDPPDLIAIAGARHAAIHVGAVNIPIRDGDRRDIAALYVAMICGIE